MRRTIFGRTTDGALLIQRYQSWIQSQPTSDEEAAPLDYLQIKNKESLARWCEKNNALAEAGNCPYRTVQTSVYAGPPRYGMTRSLGAGSGFAAAKIE